MLLVLQWNSIGKNQESSQNWLNHGGDLYNRRYAEKESRISPETVSRLRLKWEFYAGKDITATPAIFDGTLYFPSWNGNIYAVKASDGSLIWQKNLHELTGLNGTGFLFNVNWTVARATPTIADDLVIIGISGPAIVIAVERLTGELVWSTQLDNHAAGVITMSGTYYKGLVNLLTYYYVLQFDVNNSALLEAGPGGPAGGGTWGAATDKKRIYTNIANSLFQNFTLRPSTRNTTAGGWVAMDAGSGEILWSTADPSNATATGPVTIANGVLFAGSTYNQGPIYGIDAKSGKILWSYNTGATVYGGMSVSNGCIFVGNGYKDVQDWLSHGGNLLNRRFADKETKISPETVSRLRLKWKFDAGGYISATPAIYDGNLYFPSWNGYLHAVKASDGSLIWKKNLQQLTGLNSTGAVPGVNVTASRTTPAIADDLLIFGLSGPGYVGAVKRSNAQLVWLTQLDKHPRAVITMSGTYYKGSEAGPGGLGGGGIWGAATDEKRVYTNIANSGRNNFTLKPSVKNTSGGWVGMDAKNGQILWSTADPSNGTVSGPVSVANGVLFGGSTSGQGPIYAINANNGKILWSFNTGATIYGGSSISNGCIYVGHGYFSPPFTAGSSLFAFCVS
ncbi:Quinonprotein alcohol dehydrogenase-like-superfamily [Corchorus capsularis]|uniref:Quinonprotein alcohol dehydrogenase-like-superfamily n=1 Tax=Corchorus capsularis TaxID=210143 RepID=A0A1R3I9G2_COCAP|nr:Quinonprotein alcohol dehydrogenase-like-superfamily [Corchorus capsularis]